MSVLADLARLLSGRKVIRVQPSLIGNPLSKGFTIRVEDVRGRG